MNSVTKVSYNSYIVINRIMSRKLEIEKRFLVKSLPNLDGVESKKTVDIYFPEVVEHAVLRARHQGEQYELTKKTRNKTDNGYVMLEQTIDLSEKEFNFLYTCSQRRIEKVRYYVPYQTVIIEIDIFEHRLKGLILAEIEFDTEDELLAFKAPKWLGKEINDIDILAGGVLSGETWESVKSYL